MLKSSEISKIFEPIVNTEDVTSKINSISNKSDGNESNSNDSDEDDSDEDVTSKINSISNESDGNEPDGNESDGNESDGNDSDEDDINGNNSDLSDDESNVDNSSKLISTEDEQNISCKEIKTVDGRILYRDTADIIYSIENDESNADEIGVLMEVHKSDNPIIVIDEKHYTVCTTIHHKAKHYIKCELRGLIYAFKNNEEILTLIGKSKIGKNGDFKIVKLDKNK